MKATRTFLQCGTAVVALALGATLAVAADALPSWKDGKAKQSITDFVRRVTTPGKDFVPPAERVATFDNDGTLWAEQPLYVQVLFRAGPGRRRWRRSILSGKPRNPRSTNSLQQGDVKEQHVAVSEQAIDGRSSWRRTLASPRRSSRRFVKDWIATAKHPTTKQALHRDGVSTDARTAGLSARERIQDVHRFRRRHRVHAAVDGKSLWHSAGTGHRQQRQTRSTSCATASR